MEEIQKDILSEFARLIESQQVKNSDGFYPPIPDSNDSTLVNDPRNKLGFTVFYGMSADTDIEVFFPGFYEWAAVQKQPKDSKWVVLEIAKSWQAKMQAYIADHYEDFLAHFYDEAFYQSLGDKNEFGKSGKEVRDKLWNRHQTKIKSGRKPSRSPLSEQILCSYGVLLDKLLPAFKVKPNLSSKDITKRDIIIESVVEWVSGQNPTTKFDTYALAGECIRFRKPERIALFLLRYLYGTSISTIERVIGLRK